MAMIPINCGHEDSPCCGCCDVVLTGQDALDAMRDEDCEQDGFMTDAEADSDVLVSVGHGCDEDYGHYGDDDSFCEGYDDGEY